MKLFTLSVAAVLAVGCSSSIAPLEVADVRVMAAPGMATLVAATAEDVLKGSGVVRAASGPTFEVMLDSDGETHWWLEVAVIRADRPQAIGAAEAAAGTRLTEAGLRSLLKRGLDDLLRNCSDRRSVEELLPLLDSGDAQAVRVLATRTDPRIQPLFIRRAAAHDLVALSALRWSATAAAMPEIIALAHSESDFVRRRTIEAAQRAGGPLAAAWLFTLSTGHPHEDVQQYAAQALEAVETTRPE